MRNPPLRALRQIQAKWRIDSTLSKKKSREIGLIGTLYELYQERPDLQRKFPEVTIGDFGRLLQWAKHLIGLCRHEAYDLAYVRLEHFRDLLEQGAENSSRQAYSRPIGPLGRLLLVYESRPDLLSAFPEVANGKYSRLLSWAKDYVSTGLDAASTELADCVKWFKESHWLRQEEGINGHDRNISSHDSSEIPLTNARAELAKKHETDLRDKGNLRIDPCIEMRDLGLTLEKRTTHTFHVQPEEKQQLTESPGKGEQAERTLYEGILEREAELDSLRSELKDIKSSFGYNVMRSCASKIDSILPDDTRRGKLRETVVASLRILSEEGAMSLLRKTLERIRSKFKISRLLSTLPSPDREQSQRRFKTPCRRMDPYDLPAHSPEQYRLWMSLNQLPPSSLQQMRTEAKRFAYRPRITLCMSLHNTEDRFLSKALTSVSKQTYEDWELVVTDDDSDRIGAYDLLNSFAEQDRRIQQMPKDAKGGTIEALNRDFAAAKGDFIILTDGNNILEPQALHEIVHHMNETDSDLIYCDEALIDSNDRVIHIHFRPDYSPDFLLSRQYFTNFIAIRRSLLRQMGGWDEPFLDVAWTYDLCLKVASYTDKIGHIPKVLYRRHAREEPHNLLQQELVMEQSRIALKRAVERMGIEGDVEDGLSFNYFRVRRQLRPEKVSIIIPTKNIYLLNRCLNSIKAKTKLVDFEILIVVNNLENDEFDPYLEKLARSHRVLHYEGRFNFSAVNNYAANFANGEHLLFLNDDTEVLMEGSIEAMLEHSQRDEVGAVGAKLLFPNYTIQHAGVVIGLFDSCEHVHKFSPANEIGYDGSLIAIRNYSAVTAACMMIPRKVFQEAGGFDERLAVVFNDIDLCLRIRSLEYLIVYTPYAVFYHDEHASRKNVAPLHPTEEDTLFKRRWSKVILNGDPYYNPNLSRRHYDCRPRFDS